MWLTNDEEQVWVQNLIIWAYHNEVQRELRYTHNMWKCDPVQLRKEELIKMKLYICVCVCVSAMLAVAEQQTTQQHQPWFNGNGSENKTNIIA